jgi:DNA invertase Pin-like site-specific DNA recombinase
MGETMKRVAAYMRCSTDDQTVDLQRRDLLTYCSRHSDWQVVEYVDSGQSGAKTSRPALDRLMQDVRRGTIDIVCVWRYDRFGRSLRHLVSAFDEFKARGVDFVSYSEGVDTSTPQGELFFHMAAAFAQFERSLIRQRVMAGQQTAKAKGKHIGRSSSVAAATAATIRQLRESGSSWRKIAIATGVPKETARRSLSTV